VPNQVIFTDGASKSLAGLPAHVQKRVGRWINLLAEDPRRSGTRQLAGHPGIRRVHASKDYVIVYTIEHARVVVLILAVENRRDVYRGL
jgi:addiction module RelE/StbE family toxin